MKYIFLLLLISYTLSTTKKEPPAQIADIFKGVKTKIYNCILKSEGASADLKELASNNLNSEESKPLLFHTIDLKNEDREIIRNCKKDAFRKKNTNIGGVTAIGLDQAVHSKKFVIKQSKNIRKLSLINDIRLGAFNIGGIFPCIENAQPAIKVIRDTVNLFRNKDYTAAIVNIYDNITAISQGLTYCINAIFPPD